ncbi:MAG: hypothetical protein P8046_04910 [Anaerolineales bacterium]
MQKQTVASHKSSQKKEGFSSKFIKMFSEELQAVSATRRQQ